MNFISVLPKNPWLQADAWVSREHLRSVPARARSGTGLERGLARSRPVAELGDFSDLRETLPGVVAD
jgi:hypothetical protein